MNRTMKIRGTKQATCVSFALAGSALILAAAATAEVSRPLPSWNDGKTKQTIIRFVEKVTKQGGPSYIPPGERIATFDNDGTLWSEQPVYFQLLFAIDRIKDLAPEHPEWNDQMPFKAVLENDMAALASSGKQGLVTASHGFACRHDHSGI